jgi:predicted amidohydrolase
MVRDDVYLRVMRHHVERLPRIEAAPRSPASWRAEHARLAAWQGERRTPADRLEPVYEAIMVQTPERLVRDAPDRKAATAKNIRDFLAGVTPFAQQPGIRLVSFPEFAFTAAGWRTMPDIRSVALQFGGPELEQIQRFAQDCRVYVTFQQLEADPKFPGRVFNTAFVLDDSGDLISRHRKLQCVDLFGALPDTVPGSIFDSYVKEYGVESLVQVVDTPLGKLAPMICYEMMFPEVRQLYAQLGAEVIIHMTAEGYDSITETRFAWNAARRQTAMESTAYLLCANKGDELNTPWKPIGESQFIDPYGRVVRMLHESKPGTLIAKIELPMVWAARRDPTVNLAVWDRPGAYVAEYGKGVGVPNNLWAGNPDEFPYRDYAVYRQVHSKLYERGIYVAPGRPPAS